MYLHQYLTQFELFMDVLQGYRFKEMNVQKNILYIVGQLCGLIYHNNKHIFDVLILLCRSSQIYIFFQYIYICICICIH